MNTLFTLLSICMVITKVTCNSYSLRLKLSAATPSTVYIWVSEYDIDSSILRKQISINNVKVINIDYRATRPEGNLKVSIKLPAHNVSDIRSLQLIKGIPTIIVLPSLTIELMMNCQQFVYGPYCDSKVPISTVTKAEESKTISLTKEESLCDKDITYIIISIVIVLIVMGSMIVFVFTILKFLHSIIAILPQVSSVKMNVVDDSESPSIADESFCGTTKAERTYHELIV